MNAAEAAGQQNEVTAALQTGTESLSAKQTVLFTLYSKFVFAEDGFVFWVATPQTMTVVGSIHIATDRQQDEDETIGANQVILTSEEPITALNAVAPNSMWVGEWPISPQQSLQIAFSHRANYYREADVWHYSGIAVYPAMSAQLVQTQADLPQGPIVSNSVPIWISLGSFITPTGNVTVPVYPSFAVPDNIAPPYIVAHIPPDGTITLSAAPVIIQPGTDTNVPPPPLSPFYVNAVTQNCRDEVDLTLYGFNNEMAWQWWMAVQAASLTGPGEPTLFGFANSPALRDAKRTQAEIAALAMKKTIHISANYWQGAANAVAYRLILQAMIGSVTIGANP